MICPAPKTLTFDEAMRTVEGFPLEECLPSMRLTLDALLREDSPLASEIGLHNSVLMIVCLGMRILGEIHS